MESNRPAKLSASIYFWVTTSLLLALLWPSIFNTFPLVYWDTGTYLNSSFTGQVPVDRPVFYGLFLAVIRALIETTTGSQSGTLWAASIAQSGIAAFLILVALPTAKVRFVLPAVLLSTAPWYASQLMPDIFSGTLALSIFLMTFRWGRLSAWHRRLIPPILILSIIVHLSHLAIAALTLVCLVSFKYLRSEKPPSIQSRGLLFTSACCVLACLLILVTNRTLAGRFFLSEGGHVFLLGRVMGTGVLKPLLDEKCEVEGYALCPYKDYFANHDHNEFIWNDDSPLPKIGGWEGSRTEAWRIIRGAVYHYPLRSAAATLEASIKQLLHFEIGDGLEEPYSDAKNVYKQIRDRYPKSFDAFMVSRQQKGNLLPTVRAWNWIYFSVFILTLGLIGWATFRHGTLEETPFAYFAVLFVIANAIVCATLSGPNPRYQARAIWVLVLAGTALLNEILKIRKNLRNST